MAEPRWREIAGPAGLAGALPPGPENAITDVPGVRVGHAAAASGQRTGVSVVVPPQLPAPAGTATVNGTGELTGKLEIDELGLFKTPIYLCGTHALGTVVDAAIGLSGHGPDSVVIPVVGECDDGENADSRSVVAEDVERALAAATAGPVTEGGAGAGAGMTLFDYPGGIGTASRELGFDGYRVGVLLLANFGERAYLDRIGPRLAAPSRPAASHGSCIAVCATDAPLSAQQLRRLALRPLLGLARAGSFAADGSGEIGIAFGTDPPHSAAGVEAELLDRCFAAAFEAAHEAVFNCLVAAQPGRRLDGSEQEPFPTEAVPELLAGR